jgi:hypothetical protein
MDALHQREVDEKATVDGGPPRDVVTAPAHRDVERERPCKRQGIDDVGDAGAASDDRRIFVDQAVVHATAFVVAGVFALEELSGERRDDVIDRVSDR